MESIPFLRDISDLSLQTVIYGNTILQYLIALGVMVATFTATSLLRKLIHFLVSKLVSYIDNDAIVHALRGEEKLTPILQYIPFYFLVWYLELPEWVEVLVVKLGVIIITICVLRYLIGVIKIFSSEYMESRPDVNPLVQHCLNFIASVLLSVIGLLFILSNLGFNINTLLAGVGIGGMALALASQTLLADLFNYFTILIDKPFTIGDTVTVNGYTGKVEHIGLKGARMRAFSGEQVIVSNTDMTKNIVTNSSASVMSNKRVLMTIGTTYATPKAVVEQIPQIMKNIVDSVADTTFTRAHFKEFGDSALNFELVYYVNSPDTLVYMDRMQEINLRIMEEFERLGVGFAYPSNSVYMETPLIIRQERD